MTPKFDDIVAQAKREILEDIANGDVPATVASFSELHDHVDANTYGGLCDDGFPEQFANDEAWITFSDDVQDAVDAWIKAGMK